MKIWGARKDLTGFAHGIASSEYAPLIGGHIHLMYVMVCDWLKRRRNLGRISNPIVFWIWNKNSQALIFTRRRSFSGTSGLEISEFALCFSINRWKNSQFYIIFWTFTIHADQINQDFLMFHLITWNSSGIFMVLMAVGGLGVLMFWLHTLLAAKDQNS